MGAWNFDLHRLACMGLCGLVAAGCASTRRRTPAEEPTPVVDGGPADCAAVWARPAGARREVSLERPCPGFESTMPFLAFGPEALGELVGERVCVEVLEGDAGWPEVGREAPIAWPSTFVRAGTDPNPLRLRVRRVRDASAADWVVSSGRQGRVESLLEGVEPLRSFGRIAPDPFFYARLDGSVATWPGRSSSGGALVEFGHVPVELGLVTANERWAYFIGFDPSGFGSGASHAPTGMAPTLIASNGRRASIVFESDAGETSLVFPHVAQPVDGRRAVLTLPVRVALGGEVRALVHAAGVVLVEMADGLRAFDEAGEALAVSEAVRGTLVRGAPEGAYVLGPDWVAPLVRAADEVRLGAAVALDPADLAAAGAPRFVARSVVGPVVLAEEGAVRAAQARPDAFGPTFVAWRDTTLVHVEPDRTTDHLTLFAERSAADGHRLERWVERTCPAGP